MSASEPRREDPDRAAFSPRGVGPAPDRAPTQRHYVASRAEDAGGAPRAVLRSSVGPTTRGSYDAPPPADTRPRGRKPRQRRGGGRTVSFSCGSSSLLRRGKRSLDGGRRPLKRASRGLCQSVRVVDKSAGAALDGSLSWPGPGSCHPHASSGVAGSKIPELGSGGKRCCPRGGTCVAVMLDGSQRSRTIVGRTRHDERLP